MQHRFLKGILPRKYKKQMLNAPALIPISSGESIPGELLLSRAHFRFDSIAKFETLNYIYKLLKKAATYNTDSIYVFSSRLTNFTDAFYHAVNKQTLVATKKLLTSSFP